MAHPYRCIVIHEWTQSAVKLGGPDVRIRHACYGVGNEDDEVVQALLQKDLDEIGYVWLQASLFHLRLGFADPAPGKQKRLLVIFEGENSCSDDCLFWGFASTLWRSMLVKASFNGIMLSIGGKAACGAMIGTGLSVMGVGILCASSIVGGWAACRNSLGSVVSIFQVRGTECSICLEELSEGSIGILNCGHVFHPACLARWSHACTHGHYSKNCPMCRAPLCEISDSYFVRIEGLAAVALPTSSTIGLASNSYEGFAETIESAHAARIVLDFECAHHIVPATSFLVEQQSESYSFLSLLCHV